MISEIFCVPCGIVPLFYLVFLKQKLSGSFRGIFIVVSYGYKTITKWVIEVYELFLGLSAIEKFLLPDKCQYRFGMQLVCIKYLEAFSELCGKMYNVIFENCEIRFYQQHNVYMIWMKYCDVKKLCQLKHIPWDNINIWHRNS